MMKLTGLKLASALVGLSLGAGAATSIQEPQGDTPRGQGDRMQEGQRGMTGGQNQEAPRVWLSEDLMGMEVVSRDGESLGEIEDIVVRPGGESAYAVLTFGGWFGIGDKLFAMPWSVLESIERDAGDEGSERSLVLPLSKEKLKQAPGFDKDNWPVMANKDWTQAIDNFYKGDRNPNVRRTMEASAPKSQITWKLSDLRGFAVHSQHSGRNPGENDFDENSAEEIGEIRELAIDTNGRVSYVALEYDRREGADNFGDRRDDRREGAENQRQRSDSGLIAVPWDAFKFSVKGEDNDEKHVALTIPREKLDSAPAFLAEKKERDGMCESSWVTRVHEHFAMKPYWKDATRAADSVDRGY